MPLLPTILRKKQPIDGDVRRTSSWCYAVSVLILVAQSSWASPTASLAGRVTDKSGAPVADVKVESIEIETNITFFTRTDRDGLYSIPNLPPGTYRVVVSKLGMQTVVKPGIELHVQDIVALNFSMRAGSVIESVTMPTNTSRTPP